MMRVQSVEIFGDTAGSRDLRVIGSRRHQSLVDLRCIEVVPLVAQFLDQRLAHDHHALMWSKGLVEREEVDVCTEGVDIRQSVRRERNTIHNGQSTGGTRL